jgi:hypothetical protein
MNDTLPDALTEFGDELTRAIARELNASDPLPSPPQPRGPRRRRLMTGVVSAGTLAAAIAAFFIVSHGSTNAANDEHVLRAADIALPRPSAHTIVYVSVTQTMTVAAHGNDHLLAATVNAEGWFQQGGARRSLTREQVPGQSPTWQTASGRIYDPATGRVYVSPPLPSRHPRYTLSANQDASDYSLHIETARYGLVRETITRAQAHALRDGADGIQWVAGLSASGRFFLDASVVFHARPSQLSDGGPLSSTSLNFPAQLHRLLQSGNARVGPSVKINGRSAIQITTTHVLGYRRFVYDVDTRTYRPVELDMYGLTPNNVTRIVFHAYRQLPLNGHAQLLRLRTTLGTRVDHNSAAFFHHLPVLLFW